MKKCLTDLMQKCHTNQCKSNASQWQKDMDGNLSTDLAIQLIKWSSSEYFDLIQDIIKVPNLDYTGTYDDDV